MTIHDGKGNLNFTLREGTDRVPKPRLSGLRCWWRHRKEWKQDAPHPLRELVGSERWCPICEMIR